MQCINPIRASLDNSGSITFNPKEAISGLEPFTIPCRKCLPCRLNNGREKAIRAWHQSQLHQDNIFLTLTYSESHLTSSKLIYEDFYEFMEKLRSWAKYSPKSPYQPDHKIDRMVTGEYGDKNKRPHWHAIIFNFTFPDGLPEKKNDQRPGDQTYTSTILTELWGKGRANYGKVTIDSASYVARYAAKKLSHGKDKEHDYHPIHKTPSLRGLGRGWIEKYFKHTFQNGFVVLPNGELSKIPRYYVDWCKKHQPDLYLYYVTQVRPKIINQVMDLKEKEDLEYLSNPSPRAQTRPKIKETILKLKFKRLQERLKL